MRTALKPAVQVQVWAIQALLVDDKPRLFEEIEQFVGFNPEAALRVMFDEGMVSIAKVENVAFWARIPRRKK